MPRKEVIHALETITTIWRGDETEVEAEIEAELDAEDDPNLWLATGHA